MWVWNPYYGMYTFVPSGRRRLCNPFYSYCYWTPQSVYGAFYVPASPWWGYGNGNASGFSYPTATPTSGGYSGTMSSSPAASSAPAASSGSTAAAAAGGSSVGHGSASGGGRGH